MGEETDRLVLGLATAGLAVTAATYVSAGGATPIRAGLSLVKDARKVGRLGEGLAEWAGRSAREVVDAPALEQAVATGSVLRPGQTVERDQGRLPGREGGRTGAPRQGCRPHHREGRHARRAGFAEARRRPEGCRARGAACRSRGRQDPRDPEAARPRRAAAGRPAPSNLAIWLFGAVLDAVRSVLCSIKATTERATQAWLDQQAPGAAIASGAGRRWRSCSPNWRGARLRLSSPSSPSLSPTTDDCRCRASTTAQLKSPISTKARAIRSCSCTALPRART